MFLSTKENAHFLAKNLRQILVQGVLLPKPQGYIPVTLFQKCMHKITVTVFKTRNLSQFDS